MRWAQEVISDFGKSIGIQNLSIGNDKNLILNLSEDSTIKISLLEDAPVPEIIVSRFITSNYLPTDIAKKLLEMSHFELTAEGILQCAADEKRIVVASRIPERNFNIATLENSLSMLDAKEIELCYNKF